MGITPIIQEQLHIQFSKGLSNKIVRDIISEVGHRLGKTYAVCQHTAPQSSELMSTDFLTTRVSLLKTSKAMIHFTTVAVM